MRRQNSALRLFIPPNPRLIKVLPITRNSEYPTVQRTTHEITEAVYVVEIVCSILWNIRCVAFLVCLSWCGSKSQQCYRKMEAENEFEEQVNALKQYEEYQQEIQLLHTHRQENLSKIILDKKRSLHSKQMKSDLKKATAFVKKIKMITSDGLLQCIRDVDKLNLTLYITEIISSLLDITNIKITDVNNLIKLCEELYLRYDDFILILIQKMKEIVFLQEEELQKRKRIHMRMLIEFFQLGLFTEEGFFILLFKDLTGKSHPK